MSSSKKPDVRLNIPAKPLLPSAGAPLPLPAVLSTGVRSASGEGDALLPSDYIKVVDVFDIRSAARSPAGLEAEPDIALPVDRVVVLELTDGTSVITSAEKLADTLQRLSNAPARAADRGATAEEEPAPSLNALAERAQATRFGLADIGDLVSRVFTLDVGSANDAVVDEAKKLAVEWAKKRGGDALAKILEGGPSYLGTKALMWVIERRAGKDSGLRRWRAQGKSLELDRVTADDVAKDAQEGPLLVFIHGTGSSTAGSFSDIASESAGYLQSLESKFGRRIYGFEHRTFSESPIENAIELASSLPKGARVSLVTHSRGGLVGDLVCLSDFDGQIESYGRKDKAKPSGIEEIYGAQQQQLRDLSILLKNRELIIERYVRVASPARGTLLASGNLDAFLSGFLSLMGLVPALAASPLYPAFKRILLEIAKNRTRPELVPGIEAMLPESPLARLLGEAKPQKDVRMSVIAGDTDSGSILKRLGVFFTDYVFFDGHNNDLVVDTDSMYAGIARNAGARVHDERGPEVTHFRYFRNEESRIALSRWLLDPDVAKIKEFNSLPVAIAEPSSQAKAERAALRAATRGARDAELPIVVVLPGIMGSHLWVNRRDRIWFDVADLARGGLRSRLSWGAAGVEAESLFDHFYGDLCDHLEQSHEVERFAYDWRQPLDVLGASLGERLFALMDRVRGTERPIRFLAHSMGGLVVRSLAHQNAALFEELMGREGARFVMLGTPNRGSHAMVETLIGKASMIRMLARLDLTTDLAGILQAVGAFRGALSLLPRPDFQDGNVDGARNYFDEKLWAQLHDEIEDFWFGKNFCPALPQATLDQGNWKFDSVPTAQVKSKTIYVYGSADRTPCGLRKLGNGWKMLATTMGDGSVTWASGNVPGIGSSFFMPVEHGALACTERYFDGLTDLLAQGTTDRLQTVPAMRGIPAGDVIAYDAGPPLYPTDAEIAGGFLGRGRVRARPKEQPLLRIAVRAMDLRWVQHPVLIGHYTEDPIAGAEAVVDEQLLDGQLSVRKNLGLYSGPIGSATVVLLAQNDLERQRGSARGGVVIGLGSYDGSLTAASLGEAVRTGALRYLLHVSDTSALTSKNGDGGVSLCSVLIGYNSSSNLTIPDSVGALVRGVIAANKKFSETMRRDLRIASLEIVEIYLDTAISATHALRKLVRELESDPRTGCRVAIEPRLLEGPGVRQRLDDNAGGGYWPRLIITDADRSDADCPPECLEQEWPPECFDEPCDCDERDAAGGKSDGASLDKPPPKNLPAWLRRRLAPADKLRFLYLGARARAESETQQRQPGLIEKLVQRQIGSDRYNEDFSRTLFQLLIPTDFKDSSRQLDQIMLVLDRYTADIPWELMLADDQPLAVKTALVRQLATVRPRTRVRQAVGQRAYVVGNPSTAGFAAAFPSFKSARADGGITDLAGAEQEANAVAQSLTAAGFDVSRAIGSTQTAVDVLAGLYKAEHRILHIAAHGMFDVRASDGKARSGVVLSDGLLITAAEIEAMEVVPELVFLNCCHLGQVGSTATSLNRLAHSVSRELIRIGVRAVIAAGWAVNDQAASAFAQKFYSGLLEDNRPFGSAVYDARREIYQRFPGTITWGAYQAYGDPLWVFNLKRKEPSTGFGAIGSGNGPLPKKPPTAVEELIDALTQLRLSIARRKEPRERSELEDIAARAERTLGAFDSQANAGSFGDGSRGDVCTAMGDLYAELGPLYYERAQSYYQRALAAPVPANAAAPVRALLDLASIEADIGEMSKDAVAGDEMIKLAITRLDALGEATGALAPSTGSRAGDVAEAPVETPNVVSGGESARLSRLGSAYKRWAAIHARKATVEGRNSMLAKLENARSSYAKAAGLAPADPNSTIDATRLSLHPALNWLFLELLVDPSKRDKNLEVVATYCSQTRLSPSCRQWGPRRLLLS